MEKFLEQAKQERRNRYLELCLRDVVLNTSGQQELGIIEREYEWAPSKVAIVAAARLKQTRLKLGFSDSSPYSSSYAISSNSALSSFSSATKVARGNEGSRSYSFMYPSKDMKLSMSRLTLSRSARAQILRTLAHYDGRVVLLEWKNVSASDTPEIYRRVNQVAAFLQELGPLFHSLQCRGFVKDHVSKRYGYIFDLPDDFHPPKLSPPSSFPGTPTTQPLPELKCLRQFLDEPRTPSLNIRLSIATTLLETLLNLHTSGWLHKELRSENIILIRNAHCGEVMNDNDLSTYSVYVAGYVYSRADSPGEMTEPLKSEVEADLCRHPSLLGKSRESYHKSLDIFSVGCALLEIGLWSSLRQILEHHSNIRPGPELVSLPMRSMSEPKTVNTVLNVDNEKHNNGVRPAPDLMKLKHDLLLSHLTKHKSKAESTTTKTTSLTTSHRSMIMSSLEAAAGKRYTGIVEEFLAAGNIIQDATIDEHEYALDLELKARDTIKAIAGVI